MKKNKWVLLLIAFVAFLVLIYFIGACLNAPIKIGRASCRERV